jgi:hypothetical protein
MLPAILCIPHVSEKSRRNAKFQGWRRSCALDQGRLFVEYKDAVGTVESINPNTMSDNQRELCNRQIKQINESIDELMRRRMTSDLRESRLQAMEIEILTTQRRVWEILLEYDTK